MKIRNRLAIAGLIALSLGAGGCVYLATQAYATAYNYTNALDWQLKAATRPTGDTMPQSIHLIGSCTEAGGAGSANCPHNGESKLDIPVVAKRANGTTITPFPWITCGAVYDPVTHENWCTSCPGRSSCTGPDSLTARGPRRPGARASGRTRSPAPSRATTRRARTTGRATRRARR